MEKLFIGTSTVYEGTEHLVLNVYPEGMLIHFTRQIDDAMIVTPDGEILISWTVTPETQEFDQSACLLISPRDNLKEIAGIKSSMLAIRPLGKEKLKVYVTIQRN